MSCNEEVTINISHGLIEKALYVLPGSPSLSRRGKMF